MARSLTFASVSSGGSATNPFKLPGGNERLTLLFPPSMTSCAAYLEASIGSAGASGPLSATFMRSHQTMAGSGQFILFPGPGPAAIRIPDDVQPAVEWARVALGAAAAAPSSIGIMMER